VRKYTIPGGVLALSVSGSGMVSATAGSGGLYFFSKTSSQFSYNWTFGVGTSFPELAMTREAGHIVAGTNNGSVYYMDGSGQLMDRQTVKGAVSALSISETKDRVLVGSASGNVTLYCMRDRLEKLESLEASGAVTSAVISENAERISVAQLDGGISMFNRSLAAHMWTFNAGGIIHTLSTSHNGQVTAAASDTGDIYLFDEGGSQRVTKTISSGILVVIVISLVVASVIWARRRKPNESGSKERLLTHISNRNPET
jgi:WD40 repeat protein